MGQISIGRISLFFFTLLSITRDSPPATLLYIDAIREKREGYMNVGGIGTDQIQSMLAQLRSIGSQASAPVSAAPMSPIVNPVSGGVQPSSVVDFSKILQGSLNQINGYQDASQNLGQRFTLGDSSVSLSDVMMASQKASLSMQTAVQVRNKLVSAYQTIMNMQI